MALTSNHPNNELIKFRTDVAYDFLRSSRFDPYMGSTSLSVIVRMADLEADGKEIRVPLVTQLTGVGATMIYDAVATLVILVLVDLFMGLRVPEDDERLGLDLSLHRERVD